jgi:hypothetical protein
MTSGGTTKRRLAFWAAAAFFTISMVCSAQYIAFRDPLYQLLIFASLAMALISVVGVWTLGLAKNTNPNEREAMDSIK